jgi:hypothetical protein
MAYQQKDGSGALFPNDKQGNEKRPDYRGDVTMGGVQYELAGWVREGKRGKFLSLSAKVKGERKAAPNRDEEQAQEPYNDSIPF